MSKIFDLYKIFRQYPQISTDSRKPAKDSLFFALRGENFDGNRYAADAIKNGCSYAIIDNYEFAAGDRYILVDNVLLMLQELANLHRKELHRPILAITGTNGKTTTKELISAVMAKKYRICHTTGNLNNHIGVPLTLLSMTDETQYGIVEMGANHPGEIAALCKIAEPDFGVITNIGKAHIEGFGSFEGVIKTKRELYDHIASAGGTIFVNMDNEILTRQITTQSVVSYGTSSMVSCKGTFVSANPFLEISYVFRGESETIGGSPGRCIRTHLIGKYNFENVLAAICTGHYFNIPEADIKSAIENYIPSNNRSQLIKTNYNTLLMDAYNANPTSMMAAIDNFMGINAKNKTLILGDMLELGNSAQEEHLKVVQLLKANNTGKVFLIGKMFASVNNVSEFVCYENTDAFNDRLKSEPIRDSYILIKGSRGIKLEKVLENL